MLLTVSPLTAVWEFGLFAFSSAAVSLLMRFQDFIFSSHISLSAVGQERGREEKAESETEEEWLRTAQKKVS